MRPVGLCIRIGPGHRRLLTNGNARPRSRPTWLSQSWSLRPARRAVLPQPVSNPWPPDNIPLSGSSGPAPYKTASCGNASKDSGSSWSRASLHTTAIATSSTVAARGMAWAFRPPNGFPRSTQPGFYDDAGFCQDSRRPLLLPALALVRHWIRLPPRGHGRARTALVAVDNRSPDVRDR